jgi:hypothetical protein
MITMVKWISSLMGNYSGLRRIVMSNWWYRWSRDNAFPILYWVGTWSIFDWIQSFHGWLDNSLPWRLRARLKAMWEENKSLCTQLQTVQWDLILAKRTLIESVKKMRMPLRLSYPLGKVYELDGPIASRIVVDFERYRAMMMIDQYAFPHYSPELLDYVARQTAENMVEHMKEHVYGEVKKIYEKHFLGEIDGS